MNNISFYPPLLKRENQIYSLLKVYHKLLIIQRKIFFELRITFARMRCCDSNVGVNRIYAVIRRMTQGWLSCNLVFT